MGEWVTQEEIKKFINEYGCINNSAGFMNNLTIGSLADIITYLIQQDGLDNIKREVLPKKNDDLFKETGEYQIFEWGICIPYSTRDIRQKLYELKAQYEQNQLDNILDKRYINSLKKKLKKYRL